MILAVGLAMAFWSVAGGRAMGADSRPVPGEAAGALAAVRPLLETQCFPCHGPAKHKAGIDLSASCDAAGVLRDYKTWSKVRAQLASGDMPPEEAKAHPTPEQARQLAAAVERALAVADTALAQLKDPGPAPARRLNRREYTATVKDLLGISLDVGEAAGLPDDGARGYDTYAGGLGMATLEFEKLFAAADLALHAVVEPPASAPAPARAAWDALFALPAGSAPTEVARTDLSAFLRRAYRRPPAPDEVARTVAVFTAATARGRDFATAMRLALKTVLVSPAFLYRVEPLTASAGAVGEPRRVGDHELASRLSYFLWSSMPDRELSELADRGRLADPATVAAQVARLLASPRAHALVDGFFAAWLQIDHLDRARPQQQFFPQLTAPLRTAMYDETALFIDQLRAQDRPVLELLDCDYAYVNEDLARLYNLPGVDGAQLRRVALKPGDHRGGLLGMASVLTATSHTSRTSPTLRGKWVLEVLFGTPPPPPPPGVNTQIDTAAKNADAPHTFREQLARHVTDAACAACHRKMDPLGFGLDTFDGIGAWRTATAERPLDTSGVLPGGARFAGADELKKVLWERRERIMRNLVEQVFIYALGRDLIPADEKPLAQACARLAKDGYRFSALILAVVESYPFQNRRGAGIAASEHVPAPAGKP